MLLADGRPWARAVVAQPPLQPSVMSVIGHSVAPLAGALGLVGLAGVVAVPATRRLGRRITGVLLVLAGAGVVAAAVQTRLDLPGAVRPAIERASGVPGATAQEVRPTGWPTVSMAGGLLLCAAGALTAVRGGRWAPMSRRYDAPGARPPVAPAEPASAWDALDRGDDPTR